MYKRYALMTNVVLLGSTINYGSESIDQNIYHNNSFVTIAPPTVTVESALKQLAAETKDKPLIIPFLGADATAIATKPTVSSKIRTAISKRNPQILTATVVGNIFMQNTPLVPGKVIKLQVYYSGSQWAGKLLFYLREDSQQTQTVCDALQKLNQKNPLHVPYITFDATSPASKSTVTAKLRATLQKQNKIFTKKIVNNIKFDSTKLSPGKTIAVTATYQSHAVVIYVAETAADKDGAKKIAAKITGEVYLKSFCLHHYMDEAAVTNNIRAVLVNYELLSADEAKYVFPEHRLLSQSKTYSTLLVFKYSQVAHSKGIALIVESHSEIVTWHVDDYELHFIACFTPGDYQYIRDILAPKNGKWLIGTFVQILNDSHFDADDDGVYCLPSSAGRSIMKWDNKLEEHMGHFGAFNDNASETIDKCADINVEYDYDYYVHTMRPACQNIQPLYNTLRNIIKNNALEFNQHGLSVNLKWTFDKDSRKYAFQTGNFW